jgi:Skp family chaperone for outer membrane proteins
MKEIRLFAVGLVLMMFFVVSGFAQATSSQPAATAGKIVLINTFEFGDEKAGITKYISAAKALNAEFTPIDNELKTMNTKLEALSTEIENLRKLATTNPKAVDEKSAQAKIEEAEKLQRDMKFKSEDAKARYEKRQQAVMGPVMGDIYKAMQEYAKQKGYLMILDVSKMAEANLVMAVDEKSLITKDFIAFYNARPATTVVANTPK